jgi:hypothetical protein
MSRLKPQFFPKDLQYLSYAEVWLPEDAPLSATGGHHRVERADPAARARVLRHHAGQHGEAAGLAHHLHRRGGPRFWFSFSPEPRQTNYA